MLFTFCKSIVSLLPERTISFKIVLTPDVHLFITLSSYVVIMLTFVNTILHVAATKLLLTGTSIDHDKHNTSSYDSNVTVQNATANPMLI